MRPTLLLGIFLLSNNLFGQTIDSFPTVIHYEHHETSQPFIYTIDGHWVSKKKFKMIERADSTYHNLQGLSLVLFKDLKGRTLYSYYSYGSDRGEPFGEYNEYYCNGKIKIHGYYKMPNESDGRSGVIDSVWHFYDRWGKLIGIKRYSNGLANGEWTMYDNKGRVTMQKYFEKGFSHGTWFVNIYYSSTESGIYHFNFYKGFFQGGIYRKSSFRTMLDDAEYIKSYDDWIEEEKIEYVPERFPIQKREPHSVEYIVRGKFFVVIDGIIREYKEFKSGELIKHTQYDY